MKNLQFEFSTEEINTILEGLGNLPFIRVYQLIQKIQEQASRQIGMENGQDNQAEPLSFQDAAQKNPDR